MADYLPALDYTGVDVSHKALAIARVRHPGTFICSGAEGFRIDKKFDVILFSEILYYLEDPLEQLARYRELLSNEGSMIVSIWLLGMMGPLILTCVIVCSMTTIFGQQTMFMVWYRIT